MPSDTHRTLCERMAMPGSERLARIWEMLADEIDAGLLLAMPGTAAALSTTTGLTPQEVERRAEELFHRGVVFQSDRPEGRIFRPPRHLIQFHDASNQWPEAPEAFYDLWKEFMHEEFPRFVAAVLAAGMPAFMRVVPNLQAADALGNLEPFEDVASMVRTADALAVVRCPCRLEERACNTEIERCLQMNKGARYAIARGTGRRISSDEAIELLRRSADAGLVHLVENSRGPGKVICNCCTCCCAIIRPAREHEECRPVLAPSRFEARVDPDVCVADSLCVVTCPVEAIQQNPEDGKARVTPSLCLGCGTCLPACPTGALTLQKVRPADSIPG